MLFLTNSDPHCPIRQSEQERNTLSTLSISSCYNGANDTYQYKSNHIVPKKCGVFGPVTQGTTSGPAWQAAVRQVITPSDVCSRRWDKTPCLSILVHVFSHKFQYLREVIGDNLFTKQKRLGEQRYVRSFKMGADSTLKRRQ